MFDRLKTLLSGGASASSSAAMPVPSNQPTQPLGQPFTRPSNGLDQFFASLQDRSGLRILDFAEASQANVSYITSMGYGISSEDFMRSLERTFGQRDCVERQSDPKLVDQFLQENLNYPPDHYDGALVWDALQFLTPQLLQVTVDRLHDTLRPGANLLAFFASDEKSKQAPLYHYRIQDHKTMLLALRGSREQAQILNNRAIEKLFHRFQSVKFFLTRDSLREIIVRR